MKLFAGSSNLSLAKKIAEKLKIKLANYQLVRFADGEIKPVVKEEVRDETAVIIQSTTFLPNDYWMELFLLIDALKKEAVKKVIAVIPAFGYSRQNQKHQKGEPVSAHVMVNFLETMGVSEVITVDLHDETMTGMFEIPITNLSALPLLSQKAKPFLGKNFTVVAPDQGGIERARLFAQALNCNKPIVVVEKKRELDKTHQSEAIQVVGNVNGLDLVIQDDIITSGGTILHAVSALKKQGGQDIYVCITHQDFTKEAVEKLKESAIKKMFVTNSVDTPFSLQFEKLEIIDISGLLAAKIKTII